MKKLLIYLFVLVLIVSSVNAESPITTQPFVDSHIENNLRVDWYDSSYGSMSYRDYYINVKTIDTSTKTLDIKPFVDYAKPSIYEIMDYKIYEWKSKIKLVDDYKQTCIPKEKLDGNGTIYTENECTTLRTGSHEETYYVWEEINTEPEYDRTFLNWITLGWLEQQETKLAKTISSAEINSADKWYRITYEVPITKLDNGGYGNTGRIGFIINGIIYHPWANSSYGYRENISIKNNEAFDWGANATAELNIDTATLVSTGKLQSSCADLRISFNNGTAEVEIPRIIYSKCNDLNTTVHFKLQTNIKASSTYVNNYSVYYGNGTVLAPTRADMANGSKVYYMYDDFEDARIIHDNAVYNDPSNGYALVDLNAAGHTTTNFTVWNGKLYSSPIDGSAGNGRSELYYNVTFGGGKSNVFQRGLNYSAEVKTQRQIGNYLWFMSGGLNGSGTFGDKGMQFRKENTGADYLAYYTFDQYALNTSDSFVPDTNFEYGMKLTRQGLNSTAWWMNTTNWTQEWNLNTTIGTQDFETDYFGFMQRTTDETTYDNFTVRIITSNMPTISLGIEEIPTPPSPADNISAVDLMPYINVNVTNIINGSFQSIGGIETNFTAFWYKNNLIVNITYWQNVNIGANLSSTLGLLFNRYDNITLEIMDNYTSGYQFKNSSIIMISNLPPTNNFILKPANGTVILKSWINLNCSNSTDPEGDSISYRLWNFTGLLNESNSSVVTYIWSNLFYGNNYWYCTAYDGNLSVNSSIYQFNRTNIGNITMNISDCNPGLSQAMCWNFADEINLTNLTADEVDYNFNWGAQDEDSLYTSYGIFNSSTYNIQSLCMCINSTIYNNYTVGYGEIQYKKLGYSDRRWYAFSSNRITNNTITNTLYFLSNVPTATYSIYNATSGETNTYASSAAKSTAFAFNFLDTSYNAYIGNFSALLRWYPQLNSYITVDMGKTDDKGDTVMHLQTEDVDYRVGLYNQDGTLIKLLNPVRFKCLTTPCTYSVTVAPTELDQTSLTKVEASIAFNNNTNIWTYTWNDPTQDTQLMKFTVVKEGYNDITICDVNATGYTGVLTCNSTGFTGTLRARSYRMASPLTIIAQAFFDVNSSAFRGRTGLFISFIVVLSVALIGILSPVISIVMAIFGLVFAWFIGSISLAVLIGLAVMGGIVIHFMNKGAGR